MKFNYKCIEPLLKDAEKYSDEKIEIISTKNMTFKIKSDLVYGIFDPPILKFTINNGKIVFGNFMNSNPPRLYKKNAKNKIKIIY